MVAVDSIVNSIAFECTFIELRFYCENSLFE